MGISGCSHLVRVLPVVLACAALEAAAQSSSNLKLRDIKSQGGKQLGVEELRQLIPGARVTSITKTGSTRFWDNPADGRFNATSDRIGAGRVGQRVGVAGQGTWHIADNGTYCIELQWQVATEKWCRFIFSVGGTHYGVSSVSNDEVEAFELRFSR